MSRLLRRSVSRPVFLVGGIVAGLTLVASSAGAAVTTAGSTVTACQHKSTGALRVPTAGKGCTKTETTLTWNTQGVAGPRGLAGPAGPQGENGVPGAKGEAGSAGPAGPQGAAGPQGPQGPEGATGPAGVTGAAGSAGSQGETGLQGVAGPVGPRGATGALGPQGPAGPQGLPGPAGAAGSALTTIRFGYFNCDDPLNEGPRTACTATVDASAVTRGLTMTRGRSTRFSGEFFCVDGVPSTATSMLSRAEAPDDMNDLMWTPIANDSTLKSSFSPVRPPSALLSTAGCAVGTDAVVHAAWDGTSGGLNSVDRSWTLWFQ
jgi:hypothetical protein